MLARSVRLSTTAAAAIAASPTRVAPHRAAVVDEQAQRAARRGPAAGDQLVGVLRPPAGNLKGQVEVEVALSPGLPGLSRR